MKKLTKLGHILIVLFALVGYGELYMKLTLHFNRMPQVEEFATIRDGVCKTNAGKTSIECK